jgi:glycogen synthase
MFPRRWLARRATINVGVSSHVAHRVALPRTQVIWNGVARQSAATFDVAEVSAASRPTPCTPCFAFLGRLVTEKGVTVLLQACRQLADQNFNFRLKIVGDGPERKNLEHLAQELNLGDQIEFTGSVPATEVAKVLKDVIAVIMPSTCEDVAPLVAMEQMMQRRLLIASDIGGLGDMVNEVGLKFPAGDAAALANCMRRAVENPSLAADLIRRGRKRALEKFTEEKMVAEHVHLYKELALPNGKKEEET